MRYELFYRRKEKRFNSTLMRSCHQHRHIAPQNYCTLHSCTRLYGLFYCEQQLCFQIILEHNLVLFHNRAYSVYSKRVRQRPAKMNT